MHELAINATDICVGDFWVTNERAAYMAPQATFTSSLADSPFFFVTTKRVGKDTSWDFSNPLKPFNLELWGMVGRCMLTLSNPR